MKQLIFFLSMVFLFTACKKEDPTLAEESIGNYTLSTVKLNKDVVPGMTGKIVLTERSETTVDASLTLSIQGKTETVDVQALELTGAAGEIDIYQGKDLVGTVSGKTILFFLADDADLWELAGTKK